MAAFTSKADGSWSTSGQVVWNEAGVPGSGDTVGIGHHITVTADLTIGSSPNTGGTPAIAFTVNGSSLTVNAGVNVICKGDYDSSGIIALVCGAGSTWTFLPPSGQQYKFKGNTNGNATIAFNGSSISRCIIKTDKSLGGLSCGTTTSFFDLSWTLAYTDVTDMGTASVWGISHVGDTAPNITNCTFTRCNANVTGTGSMAAAGTFSSNILTDSVATSQSGFSQGINFGFSASAAGVMTIANNAFDSLVAFVDFVETMRFTGNYAPAGVVFGATSVWSSGDYFKNNLLYTNLATFYGPIKRNYCVNFLATDNPHFTLFSGSAANSVTDNVYEAVALSGAQADDGDCIIAADTPTTITGNLTLMSNLAGVVSGVVDVFQATGPHTIEHNTLCSGVQYDHIAPNAAGDIGSFKSNLVFGGRKVSDIDHPSSGGVQNVVAPTNADRNASWQVTLTAYPPGTTYPFAANGYDGNFSATPGANDIALSSDPFVASTRNLATWAASQGQAATVAAAKALLAATPSLVTQADTGPYDWVRAGYKVTGSQGLLLKDAGHDSITIGAMGYQASGGGTDSAATLIAIGVI